MPRPPLPPPRHHHSRCQFPPTQHTDGLSRRTNAPMHANTVQDNAAPNLTPLAGKTRKKQHHTRPSTALPFGKICNIIPKTDPRTLYRRRCAYRLGEQRFHPPFCCGQMSAETPAASNGKVRDAGRAWERGRGGVWRQPPTIFAIDTKTKSRKSRNNVGISK